MAFVNPNILQKIMGGAQQFGQTLGNAPQSQQEQLWQMLAGAGSGMTQAANQPGANFAQALGGGAQGMMQGQANAQQMQMQQMQMQQMQQEMDRQERIDKIMGDILNPRIKGGFAGQVDAQLPTTPQIGQATATPYRGAGAMSAQYESGGGGVSTVSTGRGDPGGPSYGTHQLSSNAGTMQSFLQSPEGAPFAQHFSGQEPGTPQFNQSYQEVVAGAGPQLEQAQRQFLERTHVQPVMAAASKAGIPVDNPGVQQALYSQAIQHSGDGNVQILNEAAARLPQNASPEQVIDAIYDAREPYAIRALERDGAAPDVIEGVRNRYRQERQQAKAALGPRQVGGRIGAEVQQAAQQAPLNGYQQRALQEQANDPLAGLPAGTRQLLAMLPREDAARALVELKTRAPAEQPAAVREALFRAGGDTELARRIMNEDAAGDEGGLTTANQTREQMIELQIANNPDVDPQTIRNSVYKRYQISRDPVTGQSELVDTYQVPGGQAAAPSAQAEPSAQVAPEDQNPPPDVSVAFGARSVVDNIRNTLADVLGNDLPKPKVEDAIRRVVSLGIQGDVLLSQQFSGRVSNQLLDMIGQLKAKPATFFEGPARGKTSLEEMRRLIDRDLSRQRRIESDPTKGPQAIKEAQVAAEVLSDYREELDSVLGAWGSAGEDAAPSNELVMPDEPASKAPPGWEDDWQWLDEEDRQKILRGDV